MKFLKVLIIVVLILIAAVVILGLVMPKSYHVERSMVIDSCPEIIAQHITDFREWESWSPWSKRDTTIQPSYGELQGEVGATYSWKGDPELSGVGSMTLTEVSDSLIQYDLAFTEPWESSSSGYFKMKEVEGGVEVTWGDEGDLPFPWNALMGLTMNFDEMLGPDFEAGLENLNAEIKKYPGFRDAPDTHYIGKRFQMHVSEITSELYSQTYGELSMYMMQNGVNFAGAPIAIMHAYDEGNVDMEIAIPTDSLLAATETITSGTIPGGREAYGVHYGAYEEMEPSWNNMEAFMSCSKAQLRYAPYEQYVTDPGSEPDTSKWQTYIVYPISE